MKVIGAGFGRTGTFSLKAALETLGFGPCYHMSEVMQRSADRPLWASAANGDQPDWAEFLGDFQATVDWPGALFWKELSEAFPQAKVLLNTRDPERWHESVRSTILYGLPGHPDFARLREGAPEVELVSEVWGAIADRQFGSFEGLNDRTRAIEAFRRHYAEVEATIPADRLLVYEVGQGWEPLCEFLDVPVPDEPFPRLNERGPFQEAIEARLAGTHRPD